MDACPASFNLAAYVLGNADPDPDKVALAILGPSRAERWSYGRLTSAVRGVGTGLLSAGFQPGDRILIRLENSVAFPLAYLGAIAVGIVPIPTSAQLTQYELDKMMPPLGIAGTIAADQVALPSDTGTVISEHSLLAMQTLAPAAFDLGDPDRLAYIIFTSGTGGHPRAVAHAHRATWARRMMWDGWYGLRSDDRLLHAGAFNWTFTLGTGLMDPWAMGATALIPRRDTSLEMLPLLLYRHDATLFAAAPGVFRKLVKTPDRLRLPKLRHALCAGEHLQDNLRNAWTEATGTGIYDAYGMTECSTFLSASPSGAPSLTPQPGRKVAVLDVAGQPSVNTPGTIGVAQDEPGLMLGYVNGQTFDLPLNNGWFQTADLAQQNDEGQITYLGRDSDLMNAGGFRVSPLEVEAALSDMPGLDTVAVTEVEVKPGTTVIAAAYTAADALEQADLQNFATQRLARYKQPRIYVHVDAFPTGPNGKLSRRKLADMIRVQTTPA
ncbi:MAG: class I adenylate-forming enzyme family protein [Pseudomonadota bacterium]